MPYESPTPPDVITDDLVLAALDRAVRHRSGRPAPYGVILAHLCVQHRSKQARQIRASLEALITAGWVEQQRQHGVQAWALTATGKRRCSRLRRQADLLPESPQHQEWRSARSAAGDVIDEFREHVRVSLAEATRALDYPGTTSDEWFALKEELERGARRLASATYCLREWAEPDDSRADVDDRTDPSDENYIPAERKRREARRVGRRNALLLLSPDPGPVELD